MSSSKFRKCTLESLNHSFPSIDVNDTKKILGRSPATHIRDEFCSREQSLLMFLCFRTNKILC